MNEQQPIFTPEQFRTQAVELSQAVAELHRRDSRMIDPHDPFENETEFHDYQSDYAEIVPQIRIPGCRIPLRANDREKSKIRRFYNIVGGFLLMHLIFSNVLALGIDALILALLRLSDTALVGDLPSNYNELAAAYISGSSSMIALNILAIGVMNVLVVLARMPRDQDTDPQSVPDEKTRRFLHIQLHHDRPAAAVCFRLGCCGAGHPVRGGRHHALHAG